MENEVKNNKSQEIGMNIPESEDKSLVVYEVNGEEVKLSFSLVRNFLTRGNDKVTNAECVQFIFICKANRLNPYVGDAYLVKYTGSPAQMITSKDAFMKRGEACREYTGFQAGVIVIRENTVVELEGSFFLPSDQLVGGWCKVSRNDRAYPTVARVRLSEYDKGKSTWKAMPGTMIRKVAIAQAFREAFPVQMGGLYVPEEGPEEQRQQEPAEVPNAVLPEFKPIEEEAVVRQDEPAEPEAIAVPAPEPAEALNTVHADQNEELFEI